MLVLTFLYHCYSHKTSSAWIGEKIILAQHNDPHPHTTFLELVFVLLKIKECLRISTIEVKKISALTDSSMIGTMIMNMGIIQGKQGLSCLQVRFFFTL